jgi:hypothetical protein
MKCPQCGNEIINWHIGPFPKDGWYEHEQPPRGKQIVKHTKGQRVHVRWRGPIPEPEGGRDNDKMP